MVVNLGWVWGGCWVGLRGFRGCRARGVVNTWSSELELCSPSMLAGKAKPKKTNQHSTLGSSLVEGGKCHHSQVQKGGQLTPLRHLANII